jgi:hypothetical protein
MAEWYYQVTGEAIGPVSFDELKAKVGDGQIEPQTLVREGADGPWVPASEVPRLAERPTQPAERVEQEVAAAGIGASGESEGVSAVPPGEEAEIRRSPLALRPCSDCGRMVSKQASVCPNCGRAFHESSFGARYQGEQPLTVFVLIAVLAVGFLVASPLAVYRISLALAPKVLAQGEAGQLATAADRFALAATGLWFISMLACTFLGGAVGRPRMAYLTGCVLGLFFGPLGVFAAFAIDKRPQCPQCASRLSGLGKECPFCHARLVWKVSPTWY